MKELKESESRFAKFVEPIKSALQKHHRTAIVCGCAVAAVAVGFRTERELII